MTQHQGYAREHAGGQPPNDYPGYGTTVKRHPTRKAIRLDHTLTEITGPTFESGWAGADYPDMTKDGKSAPLGERIIVAGRMLDEDGRPVANSLIEIWQANACGRYIHEWDQHDAPLDPNFKGVGQVTTNERGEYRFMTIKPGAYPWRNTPNAWRPQHIHFSVFGPSFATRLVTQMYFPGDPLQPLDPIFLSVPDERARQSMICAYDPTLSVEEYALGYRWDIVLRGRDQTFFEVP
jgi:protocatechuate 3,4-dioxygenase beta subunit